MSNRLVFTQGVAILRNYAGLPFPNKMTEEEAEMSLSWLRQALSLDVVSKQSENFILKKLPFELFGAGQSKIMHTYRLSENTQILVNAENGLSVVTTNDNFNDALEQARKVESKLFQEHEAAFLSGTGYLTARYGDSGSGIRIFTLLHLPVLSALRKEHNLSELAKRNFQSSLVKAKILGAGQEGNLYFLSTIDTPEKDGVARLQLAASALTEKEKAAANNIFSNQQSSLYDAVWRSLGLLTHARRLYQEETIRAWSNIRMGVENRILSFSVNQVDSLLSTYCMSNEQTDSISDSRSKKIRTLLKEYENASNGTFD